jgi:hypothetical protein
MVTEWHSVCGDPAHGPALGPPEEVPLLFFQIVVAVLAGVALVFTFQSPNHVPLPLFFVLLLVLLGGVFVASLGAFSDEVLLQRKMLRLRRHVSERMSFTGTVGDGWHNPAGASRRLLSPE